MAEVFLLFWWLTVISLVLMAADFVTSHYYFGDDKEKADRIMRFFHVAGALAGFFVLFQFINEYLMTEIMVFYETFF